MLEYIIERVSGLKFSEFMKRFIFDPLQMHNTILSDDRTRIIKHLTRGYIPLPDRTQVYFPLLVESINGAGGILTTGDDFLKFDNNFYNNILGGGQALIERTITPGRLNNGINHKYAYGLQIDELFGLKTISHTGGWPGYLTFMMRFPEKKKTTIFIASNLYDLEFFQKALLTTQIWVTNSTNLSIPKIQLFDTPFNFPISTIKHINNKFNSTLEKYVGYYHSPELRVLYDIKLNINILVVEIKKIGIVPLIMKDVGHEFWIGARNSPETGRFVESEGKIIGMILDFSRATGLRFSKVENPPIC